MNGKTDKTVELSEETLDAAAGGISDGTSNTIMFGEQVSGGGGIADGTSNAQKPGRTKWGDIVLKK